MKRNPISLLLSLDSKASNSKNRGSNSSSSPRISRIGHHSHHPSWTRTSTTAPGIISNRISIRAQQPVLVEDIVEELRVTKMMEMDLTSINPCRIGIETSITSQARVKSLSIGFLQLTRVKMMKTKFIVQEVIKKLIHLIHGEIVPSSKTTVNGTKQNQLIDHEHGKEAAHRMEVLPSPRSSKLIRESSIKMIHNCTTSLAGSPPETRTRNLWRER